MSLRHFSAATLLSLAATAASSAATLFFDFGAAGTTTAANYNNLYYTSQLTVANSVDSTGASTGIGITASGFNNVNLDGPGNGTQPAVTGAAAIFPNTATQDSFYGNTTNFNGIFPVGTITLTGLALDQVYTFDFLAARGGVTDNRETQYSVAGQNSAVAFLNASSNNSSLATVSSIAPTATGEITITVTPGPNNNQANRFFYINAMRLTSAPVPEPASSLMLALTGALALGRRRRRGESRGIC